MRYQNCYITRVLNEENNKHRNYKTRNWIIYISVLYSEFSLRPVHISTL